MSDSLRSVEVREDYESDPGCARCGSSTDFEDCPDCGGDGEVEDESDDSWAYVEPEMVTCGTCAGAGGWWRCASSYEWCQANPLPGHEQTTRTA